MTCLSIEYKNWAILHPFTIQGTSGMNINTKSYSHAFCPYLQIQNSSIYISEQLQQGMVVKLVIPIAVPNSNSYPGEMLNTLSQQMDRQSKCKTITGFQGLASAYHGQYSTI